MESKSRRLKERRTVRAKQIHMEKETKGGIKRRKHTVHEVSEIVENRRGQNFRLEKQSNSS